MMDGYGKCHECVKFGTNECPTSSKCLAFDDRPYFKQKPKKKFVLFRLMCKHNYEYTHEHKIECGMGKIEYYKCNKCGKVRTEII